MPPRDTFSHLVHIFGSKDLFISEYRNMLAERLLHVTDFRVDNEVKNFVFHFFSFQFFHFFYCLDENY